MISRRQLYAAGEPLGECVTERRPGGGLVCGGGGGGSSSSSTSTENKDSRISQQSGTAVSGDGNTVQVLDANAINKSFDFGQTALLKTMDLAKTNNALVADSLTKAWNDAKGRGAMTDYIIAGSVALAGLVAIAALRKG